MTTTRLLDDFQLTVLACLFGLGAARAAVMYARAVPVIAIDRQRTIVQALEDLVALSSLVLWVYEAVAFAWPLPRHLVPSVLHGVLVDAVAVKALGMLTMVAGLLIWLAAMRALGDAWRIGIDRGAPPTLVTHGIFAWTRNPIYAALDLLVVGTFLLQGRMIFLLLALLLVAALHLQIRREEQFLAQRHGDAYRDYCARVGRYLTVS